MHCALRGDNSLNDERQGSGTVSTR